MPKPTLFTFMDGVPVKISEQFKPPPKVRLPAGYQQRMLAETTTEEYDFKLERSVLQKMGEWRRLRRMDEEKRKERIRLSDVARKSDKASPSKHSQSQAASSKSHSNSVSPIPNSISSPSSVITYTNPVTTGVTNFSIPVHNDSILTPMQIVHPTLEVQASQISHFNFSDFEADTSSPFDNMELKTINEMEVLAHVLQPLSNSPDTNKNASCFSNYITGQNANTDKSAGTGNDGDIAENSTSGYLPAQSIDNQCSSPRNQPAYDFNPNYGAQKHYDFYSKQTWPIVDVNPGGDNTLIDQTIPIQNLNLTAINNGSQVVYSSSKFIHSESIPIKHIPQNTINTNTQDNHYSNQLINSKFSPMDDSPEYYSPSFPPSNQGNDKSSQWKSVPDIVQDLEKELRWKAMDRNRQSPILRPNSYGSPGIENLKPWPDVDRSSPEHLRPCLKKPSPQRTAGASKPLEVSKLPNPFNDLSSSARAIVKHFSEMGFDETRVARACQSVGPSDKKVLEYLLQVQSLENNANYSVDIAERAFVVNNFDRPKAVVFLDNMKQILALGFNEEDTFDALLCCDNDRDKALDRLIL